jgi:Transposase IS116/IS110/IS902 family
MLTMKTPNPRLFRSGRQFAAWIGLTPKDHSTAGKTRLGGITRAGDEGLRSVLVVGATTVIQHAQRGGRPAPWLTELLKRKPPEAGGGGTGQQDGAYRLENDGYRGTLRHNSCARPIGTRNLESAETRAGPRSSPRLSLPEPAR